jgi:hypothetical protein
MSWEDDTGPNTTRPEAFDLLGRMLANWSNAKPKAETVALFVETMVRYPKRYVAAAIENLIAEGGSFMPTPGELQSETLQVWPPKDFTGAGLRERNGSGQSTTQR